MTKQQPSLCQSQRQIREESLRIIEETGLVVRPLALTGVYKNINRAIVALVFRCEIIAGEARTSDEAREIAWLTPDELATFPIDDAYRVRLLDALTHDAPPTVRVHDGTHVLG